MQDLHERLRKEHQCKEELRCEIISLRREAYIGYSRRMPLADLDPLKMAEQVEWLNAKFIRETENNAELQRELDFTKQRLEIETKTKAMLEDRNTQLENELKVTEMDNRLLEHKVISLSQALEVAMSNNEVLETLPSSPQMVPVKVTERNNSARVILALQDQLSETKGKLEAEIELRKELQISKTKLEAELEDLTKALFEEANHMVSSEAREKHELLKIKQKLESELEQTKSRLQVDEEVLVALKEKFSQLEKRKSKRVSRQSVQMSPGLTSTRSRTSSQPSSPKHSFIELIPRSSSINIVCEQSSTQPIRVISPTHTRNSSNSSSMSAELEETSSISSLDGAENNGWQNGQIVNAQQNNYSESESDHRRSNSSLEIPTFLLSPSSHHEICEIVDSDSDCDSADEQEVEEEDTVVFSMKGKADIKYALSQFGAFFSVPKLEFSGNKYMDRLLKEEVSPTLKLRRLEDKYYRKLLESIWSNKCFIEPLGQAKPMKCQGCELESVCKWSLKFTYSSAEKILYIGELCRDRVVTVCEFYSYLRNVKNGIVKNVAIVDVWKETARLRIKMAASRILSG
eukprot:TRINITY_DN10364_c0_g1_i1.p1 TRINITY_DN10364_c0_g1~~TRINITY_DN10364_c0_g1_i1.p1  ORF type:complete len:574 (+),score=92.97 TRINITY_DN10364_c0_g1_i1:120-1841(+)